MTSSADLTVLKASMGADVATRGANSMIPGFSSESDDGVGGGAEPSSSIKGGILTVRGTDGRVI